MSERSVYELFRNNFTNLTTVTLDDGFYKIIPFCTRPKEQYVKYMISRNVNKEGN